MKPAPAHSDMESNILIRLYEEPGYDNSTYSLAQSLHPEIRMDTPEMVKPYEQTRDAIEELIVQKLISGTRLKGNDGIYFNDIKLTPAGERAAILERKRIAEFRKELPEMVKRADEVLKEMQQHREKG
jgi:hypothetical protein